MNIAAYLINKSPLVAIGFKTLKEMWNVIPPKYDHLRVFGCVAYANVKQGKMEPRAKKCMFVGYTDGVKGYKLLLRTIFVACSHLECLADLFLTRLYSFLAYE